MAMQSFPVPAPPQQIYGNNGPSSLYATTTYSNTSKSSCSLAGRSDSMLMLADHDQSTEVAYADASTVRVCVTWSAVDYDDSVASGALCQATG